MQKKAAQKPSSTASTQTLPTKKSLKTVATAQTVIVISIDSPVCSQEMYAHKTGLGEGVVRGHVDKKLIPIIKIGRHRMVNMAKLTQQCLEAGSDE